jgi:hypothetical protein
MSKLATPVALRAFAASCLAFALSACGAAPASIGDSEQPFTAGDRDDAGGEEGSSSDACAGGVDVYTAATGECPFVARGLCFSTSERACSCAGCGLPECAIAESFPAQAFCPSSGGGANPDGSTSDDPNTGVSDHPRGDGSNGSSGDVGGGSSGSPGCADPSVPACSAGVQRDPTGAERCDFIVGETCFDSAASACACAGCAADRCRILESYPAQISCE